MDEQAKIDQIVDKLYAGTLDTAAWSGAMAGMTEFLNCSGVILIAANPATQAVTRDEVSPGSREIMQVYREHWAATDIRITKGLPAPVGEPCHEQQMVVRREWQRSAVLNEILLPSDVPFILVTWLHRSEDKVVALTFQGSRHRGPFDEDDSRKVKRLIPHVQRALEIRDRLEANEVRARTLSSLVDRSAVGVIVLDQKGRILESTGLAERLLELGSEMRRASDRTLWLQEPAGSLLRRWIFTGVPPEEHLSSLLNVPRHGGLQSLCVLLAPMPPVPTLWLGADPRWLLFVYDPQRRVAPATASISRELGVSAREAEIAVLLSTGYDLLSVATRLGISLHTIRTHLKHIFEKTGSHSQSDLIRRVLLSPAMHLPVTH
jgi:DNA-binding CsgD family transcriptional regulator/PAS domain-containing protein